MSYLECVLREVNEIDKRLRVTKHTVRRKKLLKRIMRLTGNSYYLFYDDNGSLREGYKR